MFCSCAVAEDNLTTSRSRFYCCGIVPNIDISPTSIKVRHGMVWCQKDEIGIELGKEADENENIVQTTNIINPVMPYAESLPDLLYLGSTIDIYGNVHSNVKQFAVNLLTSTEDNTDICFHFNPRFARRAVIRNTRQRGSWGDEEIAAGRRFPFEKGRGTRISIFVADGQFMVAVNKVHFCKYTFRIPVHTVRALQIVGDITLKNIRYYNSCIYPSTTPGRYPKIFLPTHRLSTKVKIKRKISAITPGSTIQLTGRLNLLPQRFVINLQMGQYVVPHPIIPFHMNLRMDLEGKTVPQIIYNSWNNCSWGREMRQDCGPIMPGLPFLIIINYNSTDFTVIVNDKFMLSFPVRILPPPSIDTLLVEGDISISKIDIKRLHDKVLTKDM